MDSNPPRNGLLSGMLITAAAGLLIPAIALSDRLKSHFDKPIDETLQLLFLVSAMLMAAHKYECYVAREYDVCPVYHAQSTSWGAEPRRAIFLTFVTTFVGMLFMLALALLGPPWPLAIVAIWIAHGLHEVHHLGKSFARRMVYPGLATSLLFVLVQWSFLFPRWYDQVFEGRGLGFQLSYGLIPLALLAFYLEDRRWIARAPRSAWYVDRPVLPFRLHARH